MSTNEVIDDMNVERNCETAQGRRDKSGNSRRGGPAAAEARFPPTRGPAKMRNKILDLTRTSIPYVKGLRRLPLVKSVAACVLMQQLDFRFNDEKFQHGFYKFLEPCPGHPKYKEGDSWTDELGFSADEFRTAFDQIGVRYKSKKEFDAAGDKFTLVNDEGKPKGPPRYYCSYYDKVKRVTYYFRNHELVDAVLDELVRGK
jgi:hypothetical protein